MKLNYFSDRNAALDYLCDKYQVGKNGKISDCGYFDFKDQKIKLLPWRVERRFVELKNLIENNTLEDVSTFRFARMVAAGSQSLDELIYQELDLCEWLGNSPVSRLFAVFSGNDAVNIIAKLENGISCSVECSVMLPEGAEVIDRHEIIARRGVASDRAVDTQVPQSSIYTYTAEKETHFTDTDAEIFGLSQDDINIVRAAFKVLESPELVKKWHCQNLYLADLVKKAKQSEVNYKASIIEGGE